VREAGVEVIIPEKDPFALKVGSLYDQYGSDPDINSLIRRIREVGNQ